MERLRSVKDIIEVDLSFLERARNRFDKELQSFKQYICREIQSKFGILPYIYPYSDKITVNDTLIIYPLIKFKDSYYHQRLELEFREEHLEVQQFVEKLLEGHEDITLEVVKFIAPTGIARIAVLFNSKAYLPEDSSNAYTKKDIQLIKAMTAWNGYNKEVVGEMNHLEVNMDNTKE